MSPTPSFAALFALASALAFVAGPGPAAIAATAAVAAFGVDLWWARGRPAARRELPALLSRGVAEDFLAEVEARRGTRVRLRQALPGDLALEPAEAAGSRLRGRIVARRRGRHELPPLAARVVGPLGLASWTWSLAGTSAVEVYPDLPAARRAAAAARHSRYRDPGWRGRGPLGLGTEFESVREYQPDDDIRQVNWRATVRLGRPMSNEYRLEQDRDLICAIDCGRLMLAPLGERSRLDAAVDATAALAAVADEVGDRFGVLAFDTGERVWLPPARAGGRAGLRALYDVEPTPGDSDYAAAFRGLDRAKRALVFLFTDLVEEVAARPLLADLPVLARRHAVTVVSAADPDLEAAVVGVRERLSEVMRAAVALDVLAKRRRAAAISRSLGGEIVEAPAERLAAACVSSYLRSKARARA